MNYFNPITEKEEGVRLRRFFFGFSCFCLPHQALKRSFVAAGGHSSFRALALELPSCRVASLRSPGSPRPPRGPQAKAF